jgi:hypothetical protein
MSDSLFHSSLEWFSEKLSVQKDFIGCNIKKWRKKNEKKRVDTNGVLPVQSGMRHHGACGGRMHQGDQG